MPHPALTVSLADPRDPQATALLERSQALLRALFPPEDNFFLDLGALAAPDIRFFAARRGARTLGSAARAAARGAPPPAGGDLTVVVAPTCVEITIYGAFVLNQRDVLHAIDATPARWRGDAGSSPLDQARNGRVIECTRHC